MKGIQFTEEHRKNIAKNHHNVKGANNPNWKNGKSTKDHILRTSKEFKEWRWQVYTRDGFRCVRCNSNKSGTLTADHIKPIVVYPELIFEVSNGQTLCRSCHYKKNTEDRNVYMKGGKYVRI